MHQNRPSLSTLLVLGLVGSGSAWPETAPPPAESSATVATRVPAAASLQAQRARLIELRARQQAAPDDPEAAYALGAFYLDQGEPIAAAEQLQRAIDGGTGAADAWLLLGRSWLLQDKLAEVQARIPIDEIADPAIQAEVRVLQGLAWIEKERPDEARRSFKEALDLAPDLSNAYLGLARLNLAAGNALAAREALTSAAQGTRPDTAEIADLQGQVALADKDYAAAEVAFQAACDARPDQIWRRRPLAHVQLVRNRLDAADVNIALVAAAAPRDPALPYLSAYSAYLRKDYQRAYEIIAPTLRGRVEDPGTHFIAGASAFWLGNDNQAADLLAPYLEHVPSDGTARRMLATSHLRLGNAAAALATIKPLLEDGQPDAGALSLAGQAALLTGDGRVAVGYLESAVAQKPDDKSLSRLLGAARITAGDRAAGIAALERLAADGGPGTDELELGLLRERLKDADLKGVTAAAARYRDRHPDRPEGYLFTGIAQARTGALEPARKSFEQVLSLDQKNVDALIGLADVSLRQGDVKAAEAAIERAVPLRKSDPVLMRNYTAILLAAGKPQRAIDGLRQATQANPNDPRLLVLLAAALTDLGQPLDALQTLEGQGDGKNPAILAERARAALRAGRADSAVADARARAALEPQSAAAQLELGRALEQAEQLPEAREAYRKARSLQPDNADAAIGSARLKLLALSPPLSGPSVREALNAIAETLKQHPTGADATRLRAIVAVLVGKPDQAAHLLEPLYAAEPDADTALALAFAKVQDKDPKGGIALLRRHLERFPKDPRVRLMLARYLMADRQTPAAVEQLKTLLEQDWSNTDAQIDLAALLIQDGRADEAKPHLDEAVKARPADERVKALRAAAGAQRGGTGN